MSGTYDQSSFDVAKIWIEDQPELKGASKATIDRETDELAQVIQDAVEAHLKARSDADWKLDARPTYAPYRRRSVW